VFQELSLLIFHFISRFSRPAGSTGSDTASKHRADLHLEMAESIGNISIGGFPDFVYPYVFLLCKLPPLFSLLSFDRSLFIFILLLQLRQKVGNMMPHRDHKP